MRLLLTTLLLSLLTPHLHAEKKPPARSGANILLICIDDLRPELPSFGKNYIHAPNIEKLFTQGRLFKQHYVQAPTCGASRYALLTGLRKNPYQKNIGNNAFAKHNHTENPTLPALLKQNGYLTISVGKVSHYPGNLEGKNWADPTKQEIPNAWDTSIAPPAEWKSPQGLMHGYANGKNRERGKTPPYEAIANARYPDDAITETFKTQLTSATKQQKPWLIAVGLIRPHLPFACEQKYLDLYKNAELPPIPNNQKPPKGKEWHSSGEFFGGYKNMGDPRKDDAYATLLRKHYAACTSSSDDHIGEILKALQESGQADNTIIVLWGDHGWHLGEHKIWGKHTLYPVALHSPFFMKIPNNPAAGTPTNQIVETIDLYPTLCHLTNIPTPKHLQGQNLTPILKDPTQTSKNIATSHWRGKTSTITPKGQTIK